MLKRYEVQILYHTLAKGDVSVRPNERLNGEWCRAEEAVKIADDLWRTRLELSDLAAKAERLEAENRKLRRHRRQLAHWVRILIHTGRDIADISLRGFIHRCVGGWLYDDRRAAARSLPPQGETTEGGRDASR